MKKKKKNKKMRTGQKERKNEKDGVFALLSKVLRTCGDVDHLFTLQAGNELGHQLPGLVAVPETPVYSDSEREHIALVAVWKVRVSHNSI
jgi:hypothetical protein